MSTVFVEFTKPTMAPAGGMMGTGEIAGFDPVTAASLIASGVAVSSSAPAVVTPPTPVLVLFHGAVKVGAVLYNNGEEAGFPAALAAALVAQGSATLV
jgi:hypothetical protein